ncbi:DUF2207 domain-containing protein [Clostridium oryzae]|uniref:DUF2207 domain-containing protein n=1 Tax=Clostridium oryzae TaxID=1450648 RepID=A0A1V4IQ49_9CLOT|nr:DUF2207 domain-containing protein [Clostridium oryzae]OPJ62142.1 hypothetical protein CLORY_19650 [Clostridium oryzae]
MGILKRGSFLFAALVFIMLNAVVPSSTVFASSGNYYISAININAAVDENGDMSVKEELNYIFDGSFNGVKRDINTSGSNGISDVKVKVSKGGDTVIPRFELNNTNQGKEIKIYSKSTRESKKFSINYKVKDVITKYKDLAELKWLFYKNEDDVKPVE